MNFGFDLTAIYIVTGITTFTSAFVGNSFQSAMTEIFNAIQMQKMMGYQQSIMSLSNIIAPATAGALIGLTSIEVILGIFVVLGFVVVIIDLIIDFKLHYDENLYEKTEELTFLNTPMMVYLQLIIRSKKEMDDILAIEKGVTEPLVME